jgi:hypothetical protein
MLKIPYDKFANTSNLAFVGKYVTHRPPQCRVGCTGEAPPTTCDEEIVATTPSQQKVGANGASSVLPQCQMEYTTLHGDVYEC